MPSVINSDNGVISGTSGLKTSGSNDGLLDFQSNGTRIAGITTSAFQVGTNNISAVNSMGFRNRIINGDMRIDQRNAGASVTPLNTAYTIDRWFHQLSQASKISVQRSTTAPAGFINSALITSLSAYSVGVNDYFNIVQAIEGFNVADFGFGTANAQTLTISFWVRSSLTGTFGGSVLNSGQTRAYPFTYTISAANTWEQKSVTIAGDTSGTWLTDNGIGLRLSFGLGVGSNFSSTAGAWAGGTYISATGATSVVGTNGATFYITGVQLEAGSVATPFERRDYGRELMMCQRYLPVIDTSTYFAVLSVDSATTAFAPTPFQVTARTAPTGITVVGTFSARNSGGGLNSATPTFNSGAITSALLTVTTTGLTQGQTALLTGSSGSKIIFNGCEL